jgi:hypothetical protein
MKDYININGYNYVYYLPDGYEGIKRHYKQMKQVREKIRAIENGCYKDKKSRKGKQLYGDYPQLLVFLEGLLNKS